MKLKSLGDTRLFFLEELTAYLLRRAMANQLQGGLVSVRVVDLFGLLVVPGGGYQKVFRSSLEADPPGRKKAAAAPGRATTATRNRTDDINVERVNLREEGEK